MPESTLVNTRLGENQMCCKVLISQIRVLILIAFTICIGDRAYAQGVITITDQNFNEEIIHAKGLVLVHFWAPWAGPSRKLAPIIEQVSKDYQGKVRVGKLNVDDNMKTPRQYNVQSIPTLILWSNGQVRERLTGGFRVKL